MIRHPRPRMPANFEQRMEPLRTAILAGEQREPWKHYKRHFRRAQRDKCGYCESRCDNHPAAVEHYAPKSQLSYLQERDGQTCVGQERGNDDPSPDGRERVISSTLGFANLACTWNNWLMACYRCNTSWKSTLFPVEGDPPTEPSEDAYRRRLLLNPFDDDPEDHLAFDHLGVIDPLTVKGRATVETCGLHRISLNASRLFVASSADRCLRELLEDQDLGLWKSVRYYLQVLSWDTVNRAPHAGVVRSRVRQLLGLTWPQLRLYRRGVDLLFRLESAIAADSGAAAERAFRGIQRLLVQPNAPRTELDRASRGIIHIPLDELMEGAAAG